jgi:B12-binding domain/radical SAM domain protein
VFGLDLHWLPHAHGALGVAELVKQVHPDAKVLIGGLSGDLDWIDVPAYDFMTHAVFKYRNLADFLPYLQWLRYPSTMLLNSRGCTYDCAICGGSRTGYRVVAGRAAAAMRSPEKLVADAKRIASFSRAPMVHDPRIGGIPRAQRFFELFGAEEVLNELVIEVFYPAKRDFFAMVRRSTARWSMQITIESPAPAIRKVNGKFPVPNDVVEATLAAALEEGCGKLDLFFMVGMSGQTPAKAMETVDYCRHLVERFRADRRLQFYAAPLGPFLDPGSRAFEDPSLGYHTRFTTLEEHRQARLGPTWREMLAYETDWMTRDQIVEATYAVGAGMNDLKLESGLIDAATHDSVARHFAIVSENFPKVDAIAALEDPERRRGLRELAAQVEQANTASLVGEHELEWKTTADLRVSRVLARHTAAALPRELSHGAARLVGRYDTAVAQVLRLPTGATLQVGATRHPAGDGPAGRRRLDHDDAPVDAGRREQEPRTR